MKRIILALAAFILAITCLSACSTSSASKQQAIQNGIAATTAQKFNSAVPYPYQGANMPTDPLERENLARRLATQNSSGSTAYVYLFTYSGQVIGYYVIKGKVSSTGSQMTSTQINVDCSTGSQNATCTNDAIGDDGTYGPEEGGQNGVFFFTTTGTLVETNQPWVSSTTPIPVYANVPQLDAKARH